MSNHNASKFRFMEFDNSEGSQRIDFKCNSKNFNYHVIANPIAGLQSSHQQFEVNPNVTKDLQGQWLSQPFQLQT